MTVTATLARRGRTVQDWLDDESFQQHLMRILPKHVRAEQFLALAMSIVKKTPKLRECTVPSMIAALVTAARLGLSIDGPAGGAYLVPFRNKGTMECQLMPDYRGLQKLARQTQEVKQISACVVYEGDEFSFQRGTSPEIIHSPKPWKDGKEPKITHCYAVAWWQGQDMPQFEVMQVAEIEKVRASAKSRDSLGWTHWFGEMGKKTVFKRLGKWLPSSAELLKAISLDDQAEAGIPQTLDFVVDVESEPSTPKAAPRAKSLPTKVDDESVKAAARPNQGGAAAKGTKPPADAGAPGAAPDSKLSDEGYKAIHALWKPLSDEAKDKISKEHGFGLLPEIKDWTASDANDLKLAIEAV